MSKKVCSTCGKHRSLVSFYRNRALPDGYANVCKSCQRMYTDRWRENNPEVHKALGRRNKAAQRKREGVRVTRTKWNEWYAKNAEHRRQYRMERYDPIKAHAQNQVMIALRNGSMERPKICSKCNKRRKIDAHHADYSKPLRVTWVCRKCHRLLQNK